MIKKLLLPLLLIASPLLAGEDFSKFPIGPFQGLNNRDSSYAIGSGQSPDLLNVDLTPGGKSVFKRDGYGVAFTLTTTTSPVHGVYDFYDSAGNEVSLFFNDNSLRSSINGAASSVVFSTGSVGPTYQCTDSLGFAYCANTNRTTLLKTNGVTATNITVQGTSANYQANFSTGTMVATAVTRLAMAGFAEAPSRIDFSADSDFTTWGTGPLGTSPAQFTINAPGAKITHIVYAFGRLMWFKDTSFGYILIGVQPFQADWVVKTVSYDVGTNDNTSIYREGILYFRGKDGHIYSYDGNTYDRMTREISGTISQAQIRGSGSWTQSTAAEFGAGATLSVDTTTVLGSVQLSTRTANTILQYSNVTPDHASGNVSGCTAPYYQAQSFISTTTFELRSVSLYLNTLGDGFARQIAIKSDSSFSPGTVLSSTSYTDSSPLSGVTTFTIPGVSIVNGTRYWITVSPVSSCSTSFLWLGSNAGSPYTEKAANGGALSTALNLDYRLNGGTWTYVAIGTFTSAVNNAPNLSSWDTFLFNGTLTSSQTFQIRSATGAFTLNSSTPTNWTTIANGNIPTVSTGSYFQLRDIFIFASSQTTPVLTDFTQAWFEGSATDKCYGIYFNDHLWFSVAIGSGVTTNNRILNYDMLNQAWLIYDIPANGLYIRSNDLYFGSATSGYIFKYGDGDNDNGSAINSYWRSKDFFGSDPFTKEELANVSIAARSVSNSSMTVTLTGNGNRTATSYIFPLSSSASFIHLNKNVPAGTDSSEFNLQFGNNAANQPWEVFAVQIGIRPNTWKPGINQ